jgi:hypothetical protein
METPFFSNRLAVGNAVVGAWLKVYSAKEIGVDTDAQNKTLKIQSKKEWWEMAPRQLEFKPNTDFDKIRHGRKPDEIYHFLLPDKNMVPSAGIKMLKEEYDPEAKKVANWKKDWCKPISLTELVQLKQICIKIDELLAEYYQFQRTINLQTSNKQAIFGAYRQNEQADLALRSYDEKERLADQRNRQNAPYFKLKMVMDYWCSLWFWDVRQAGEIPTRQQYWQDIAAILELDTNKALDGIVERRGQQKLFETEVQLSFAMEPAVGERSRTPFLPTDLFAEAVVETTQTRDLFDNNQRLTLVSQLARQYHFFHPQLEFLDVFWERGGFDLIAGNPPWLKIEFEEKDIISEKKPEVYIRNNSAPEVKKLRESSLSQFEEIKEIYYSELIEVSCLSAFLGSTQNYPFQSGQSQASNLYKGILENSFSMISPNGYIGLVHPEGPFEDPKGQILRKEIYQRLKFHFQFKNEFVLFSEIDHHNNYSSNIYSGRKSKIDFLSIHNLFHPSTIDGSFIHDGKGVAGGFKIKDEQQEKLKWNIAPHKDRIVRFTQNELVILAKTFENSRRWEDVKLVSIHTSQILSVLMKLSLFEGKVEDAAYYITDGWRETDAINAGLIERKTKWASLEDYELIRVCL